LSYRAWPAALVAGASLAAACVVVGDHVVATSDGCLDAAGWFTATPVVRADRPDPVASGKQSTAGPDKADIGARGTIDEVGRTSDQPDSGKDQISGCLDLDRIEVPAPPPASDGRA